MSKTKSGMGNNTEQTKSQQAEEITKIEYQPEHIIASLLAQIKQENIHVKFGDFFTAIYKLQQDERYKPFLSFFVFSTKRGPHPYSENLDNALFRLNESSLLEISNPAFCEYRISNETKDAIKKIIIKKYFSRDQQKLLKEMGKKFEKFLHTG